MSKTFKQCRLTHPDGGETIGWIETRGARVGYRVELLTGDGDFWTVSEVYEPTLSESEMREQQRLNRNSLPSIAGRS
jgi:hypothetical protein